MQKHLYKAVLFDMDGTLLDTLEELRDIVNHTMRHYGFRERTLEEIKSAVGNGVGKLVEYSLDDGKNTPDFDGILAYTRAYYDVAAGKKTKPYDGVCDLVHRLTEDGVKCAVVTNKMQSAAEQLTKRFFPDMEVVSGERESEGIKRKPAPDMVIRTANDMNVPLEDCVYVGDSEVDILTAHNAGLPCISVLWGFREKAFLESCGADLFAETTDELYRYI